MVDPEAEQEEEEEETTTTSVPSTTSSPCNCDDQCPEKTIIGSKKERSGHQEIKKGRYDEDGDGDGELTICARNRDEVERTFASVCHMMCHNNCTRFGIRKIVEYDEIITYVSASRENFYKLHDGACPEPPTETPSSTPSQ